MTKTEVVKAGTPAREPKPIKPSAVRLQDQTGHCYKVFVVDMPDDTTLDDVGNRPELWKAVQADMIGKALSEDDKIEMRWQTMRAFAIVDHADANGVTFCDIRKVSKRDRDREAYNDGTYAVKWVPGGWTYFRIKDGVRMTSSSWSTPDAAKAALIREQYPARVA